MRSKSKPRLRRHSIWNQNVSLLIWLPLLIALPLLVWATLTKTSLISKATSDTPTLFGQALQLDGQSGYITISNSETVHPQLGYTWEMWYKPDEPAYQAQLFSRKNSSEVSYSLSVRSQLYGNVYNIDHVLVVYSMNGVGSFGCGNRSLTHQITVPVEQASDITRWHHVAAVVQPNGNFDLFVNGQRSSGFINTNSATEICQRTLPIHVGAYVLRDGVVSYLKGQIDELRISSVSRYVGSFTPSMLPLSADDHTVVLYHFDEEPGTNTITDSSANGHDGILTGSYNYVTSDIVPLSTPTPKVYTTSCKGRAEGSRCVIKTCSSCPSGQDVCPSISCAITYGTCTNQQCIL